MANWYCSRESVKRAGAVNGTLFDNQVDRIIEATSRSIDKIVRRGSKPGRATFIPSTETRLYRWPRPHTTRSWILWLDGDLLSVTTLHKKAQDSSPVTISSDDFFLEPNNFGPPYNRIEIDQSSSAAYEAGDTAQRSISVTGSWGYSKDTVSCGTIVSGLASSTTATTMVCSDGSVVNVGDTLLDLSEQMFVSERSFAALDSVLINDASVTQNMSNTSITLDGSHGVVAGENIRLDSEQLFVESVSTNVLTVIRAFNGSTLAAHSDDTAVHINRTLTIERGINGTTAVTHPNSTAMTKYEPPFDITQLCVAETLRSLGQENEMWNRTAGQIRGQVLDQMTDDIKSRYQRLREAAV